MRSLQPYANLLQELSGKHSRTLEVICADLAVFKNLVLITDRGYDTLQNVERRISKGQRMIMRVKTGQREALKAIETIDEFKGRPKHMELDVDTDRYIKAFDIDYEVKGAGESVKSANQLRLHLYFDPVRRALDLIRLDREVREQEKTLLKLLESGGALEDIPTAKRDNRFHKLVIDKQTRKLKSFECDEGKLAKAEKLTGFFSIMTHRLDFDSKRTYESYRLRDEQEKRLQQMKSQMVSDRRRNWPEEGKAGRGKGRKTLHFVHLAHFGVSGKPCLEKHEPEGRFLLIFGGARRDESDTLHRASGQGQEDHAVRRRSVGHMRRLRIRGTGWLRPIKYISP